MQGIVRSVRIGCLLCLMFLASPALTDSSMTGTAGERSETVASSSKASLDTEAKPDPSSVERQQAAVPLSELSKNGASKSNSGMTAMKPGVSETSSWSYVLLVLLSMIACILLMAWIARRFSGMTGVGGKDLRVVNSVALGTRERVAVIDVKGQQFLIGVTPQNISLLHAFDDAPIEARRANGGGEFAEKLQALIKGESVNAVKRGEGENRKGANREVDNKEVDNKEGSQL